MDGTEGVASTTNAGQGGGKVKDGFQALVLEIDIGDAPEGGVWFKVEFHSMMEVRGIEEGVECITTMFFQRSFVETVGSDGNVDRQDRWGRYWGIRCRFYLIRRRSRQAMDIWRFPTLCYGRFFSA